MTSPYAIELNEVNTGVYKPQFEKINSAMDMIKEVKCNSPLNNA